MHEKKKFFAYVYTILLVKFKFVSNILLIQKECFIVWYSYFLL